MRNVAFALLICGLDAASTAFGQSNQNVCGPLCVKTVLASYEVEADLTELIRKMQWPQLERGASMQALKTALEERGVYVQAVGSSQPPAWDYPAIVHLKGDTAGGHYVVLYPGAAKGRHTLWDPVGGWREATTGSLVLRMSGRVLLTAPMPFDAVREQRHQSRWAARSAWTLGIVLAAACGFVAVGLCKRR